MQVFLYYFLMLRPETFISGFTGFFSDSGSRGREKALKMTSWLVIFRAFYFFLLISPEQTVKLVR